jgi:hypothetical protein
MELMMTLLFYFGIIELRFAIKFSSLLMKLARKFYGSFHMSILAVLVGVLKLVGRFR